MTYKLELFIHYSNYYQEKRDVDDMINSIDTFNKNLNCILLTNVSYDCDGNMIGTYTHINMIDDKLYIKNEQNYEMILHTSLFSSLIDALMEYKAFIEDYNYQMLVNNIQLYY